MGIFLQEITALNRPRVSVLAVVSLIVAVTGFISVIGFIVGPVLAHVALVRLRASRRRGETTRGRRLAITALWVSYGALAVGALALIAIFVVLIVAYAALPSPHFF